MKKTIILCLIFVLIGFLLGNEIWKIESKQKYYFLVEGIYDNNNIFENNINNLRQKVLEYKNHKIFVYVGITKDLEIAKKIKKIYKDIQIEEVYLSNEEFEMNIEQLDLLVKKAQTKDEIIKIEEVVLAKYEEILKNRE